LIENSTLILLYIELSQSYDLILAS
jgi:hypothetical protein